MAVLPEDMKRIDPNDVRGSLLTIEQYIRYMKERIEFAHSTSLPKLYAVMDYSAMALERGAEFDAAVEAAKAQAEWDAAAGGTEPEEDKG